MNNTDTFQIQVEVRQEYYSDEMNKMIALKKKIAARMQSVIGLQPDIKIVEPRSIERSMGKAKQLSIFLENKKGRFTEVAKILGEAGVNMSAFTVAENSDFGILRLIVSDTEKAISVLREKLYAVSVADVVCLHCPNQPGALAKAMDIITSAGIFIEYMYAFSQGDAANVIIRPDDVNKCAEVLKANKLELIAASDLYKL